MPISVSNSQCEGSSSTVSEDASAPMSTGNETVDELVDNFYHDVVEHACKALPFVPDSWCDAAGQIAEHVADEVAKVPPELQWNVESS